jgi:glucokinase
MKAYDDGPRLLADVGGTNARFALETGPRSIAVVAVLRCDDFENLHAAIRAYLTQVADVVGRYGPVRHAAIAIANPVDGDVVNMVNRHWSFSVEALRTEAALETLLVENDFAALAMALPHLDAGQCRQVGSGGGQRGRPLGLIGPGTGLGVAGLIPIGPGWVPLPSEAGHATFAPADDVEVDLLRALWNERGHVSCERLLSGSGLEAIHRVLSGSDLPAHEITRAALDGDSDVCIEAVMRFCAILGTVAGNVALAFGATGGVYIGGGIVPRFGALFDRSPFRARFEDKGRMSSFVAPIPTYLITEKYPAFPGISAMLAERLVSQQ